MKINAIITGSTGMVGKGVLLECLDNPEIISVLLINRSKSDIHHPKISEIILLDFKEIQSIEAKLIGYNACFHCMGISSTFLSNDIYKYITYDLTVLLANTLVKLNQDMTFCYVSGQGTSSLENSKMNWANIKGKTENYLLALPFRNKFMFRPGIIEPLQSVKSKTKLYTFFIVLMKPFFGLFHKFFPDYVTTTEKVGRSMINSVLFGFEKTHLETRDINKLANE